MYLCVYVHVVHMCGCVYTGPKLVSEIILDRCSILHTEAGSLSQAQSSRMASPAAQLALGVPSLYLLGLELQVGCHSNLTFQWVLGSKQAL